MKNKKISALVGVGLLTLGSCGSEPVKYPDYLDDNYRNYYHIFVRSFADSNGDGIGDLNGITAQLDFLRNIRDPHAEGSLGINGIFLSPIHPAPTYHKYDIKDFFAIDEQFGTMADFDRLIDQAHRRGIRVILDGVFNHISSQHPLFTSTLDKMRANPVCYQTFAADGTLAPACAEAVPEVKRFRFVQKGKTTIPGSYSNRIQDYELGDLRQYLSYEGFAPGMVDLNLDDPDNRDLIGQYIDFWLDRGVDGFRLDAVQSYYGEVLIDLDKNAEMINFINARVKAKKADGYVVAEGPWNYLIRDYQAKTKIESYFNFDSSFQGMSSLVSDDMVNNDLRADHFANYLLSLENYFPDSPDAINANFLSNHDIGRITASFYRYDTGAIDVDQLKLYYGLMNLVRGSFFFYYGDEIGMYGRKGGSVGDEANRGSYVWGDPKYRPSEMVRGETEKTLLFFDDQGAQLADGESLLSYCCRLTRFKDVNPALARGRMARLESPSDQLLLLQKTYGSEELLIAVNLAQTEQSYDIASIKADGELRDFLDLSPLRKTTLENGRLTLPRYSIALIK